MKIASYMTLHGGSAEMASESRPGNLCHIVRAGPRGRMTKISSERDARVIFTSLDSARHAGMLIVEGTASG